MVYYILFLLLCIAVGWALDLLLSKGNETQGKAEDDEYETEYFCESCGQTLSLGDKFCSGCGYSINWDEVNGTEVSDSGIEEYVCDNCGQSVDMWSRYCFVCERRVKIPKEKSNYDKNDVVSEIMREIDERYDNILNEDIDGYEFNFSSDSSRRHCNLEIIMLMNVFVKDKNPFYNLLKKFFVKYSQAGVSFDSFQDASTKICFNRLENITEKEHKSFNFFIAVLLYYLEFIVNYEKQVKWKKQLENLLSIVTNNETMFELDRRYCRFIDDFVETKYGQKVAYKDNGYWLYLINFKKYVSAGVSPSDILDCNVPNTFVDLGKDYSEKEIKKYAKQLSDFSSKELDEFEVILGDHCDFRTLIPDKIDDEESFAKIFNEWCGLKTIFEVNKDVVGTTIVSHIMVKYFESYVFKFGTEFHKSSFIHAFNWLIFVGMIKL